MKILQIKTRGLKNLSHDVVINFSNTGIENGVQNIKKLKGIYGNNGAGKSAFIGSVDLYQKLLRDRKYLFSDANQKCLNQLINNKTKEFFFEAIFYEESDKKNIYKHSLFLKFNPIDNSYYLDNEYFGLLKGRTINEKYEPIVSYFDKKYVVNEKQEAEEEKYLFDELKGYTGGASFIASYVYAVIKILNLGKKNTNLGHMVYLFVFSLSLNVFIHDEDKHEGPKINEKKMKQIVDLIINNKKIETDSLNKIIEVTRDDKYVDEVMKFQLKSYEEGISLLTNFIKIFKTDLIKIGFDKKQVDQVFMCRKQFYYNENPIDIEYESSGIKHLVKMHSFLQKYISGGIVFIDEMDVNINSVYLGTLLTFLKQYGKGQLCFTSHNLEPMNILNFKEGSINVIGLDNQVDVWTKTGNQTPTSFYKHGYFDHSPFNVEPFEFARAFDIAEE